MFIVASVSTDMYNQCFLTVFECSFDVAEISEADERYCHNTKSSIYYRQVDLVQYESLDELIELLAEYKIDKFAAYFLEYEDVTLFDDLPEAIDRL